MASYFFEQFVNPTLKFNDALDVVELNKIKNIESAISTCVAASQSSPSNKKLKMNFSPKNFDVMDKILLEFKEPKLRNYEEWHFFTPSYSNILEANTWIKVILEDGTYELVVRNVKQENGYIHYHEGTMKVDPKILPDTPDFITIRFLVQRNIYVHKKNPRVQLSIDLVQYPKGDMYTVASLNMSNVSDDVIIALKHSNSDVAFENIIPAASKITIYMKRYNISIYQKLASNLFTTEQKVQFLIYMFPTLHPNLIETYDMDSICSLMKDDTDIICDIDDKGEEEAKAYSDYLNQK